MTVSALVSVKSSAVTTAALVLTLAGARPTVLVEADPSGGSIRAGFLQGQSDASRGDFGLQHLAQADRAGTLAAGFEAHLRQLEGLEYRRVLAGLTDPQQAAGLERTWAPVGRLLRALDQGGFDVLVDAGRMVWGGGQLHPSLFPGPLLYGADLVLLVVRATLPSVMAAVPVVPSLREELARRGPGEDALGVLLVEEGGYRPHEVSRMLGLPVLASLPWDPLAAAYLTLGPGRGRRADRSTLLRAARTSSDHLHAHAQGRRARLLPGAGLPAGQGGGFGG
jgi:hypothetical protein